MRLTIQRLLDTNKFLATDAGKQLADFLTYVSDFSEQMIRGLRNQLTFQDNFKCDVRTVTLAHAEPNVVSTNGQAIGIIPIRVISTSAGLESLNWYYNIENQLIITPVFSDGQSHEVVLVILT